MIREAIIQLSQKQSLTYEQSLAVMNEIMDGRTTPVQTSAYLTALSMKGETTDEIAGSAAGMRAHATLVHPHQDVLEIVGTGGDRSNSFNISSTAALVIASSGQRVAKHGNRAASSQSGAADCLEALGVSIDQPPEKAVQLLDDVGICFFFAQKYHTSMKYVGPIRKELAIHTIFNILGPLTNPASPTYQVLGVYDPTLMETMADALSRLGVKRGMVVYAEDHMDELSASSDNRVLEFCGDERKSYTVTPEELGLTRCQKADLVGGTPQENADITRAVLAGKKGPQRDTVLMNAAAGLYVCGKASSLKEGVALAEQLIDSGSALNTLTAYIKASKR